MFNSKRLPLAVICLITSALMLVGCLPKNNIVSTPTDAALTTDAPATNAPESSEEPVLTEEPEASEAPEARYFESVPFDAAYECDIDGDDAPDTILIGSEVINEYGDVTYTVNITLAAYPDKTFTDTVDYCYDGYAVIVDCDSEDSRRELLLCVWQDSEDGTTKAYRVNAEGDGIKTDEHGYFLNGGAEELFFEEGIRIYNRMDVLGTFDVYTSFTITDEGFKQVGDRWYYPENAREIAVLAGFPVTVTDDATGEPYGMTVEPGSFVVPIWTDRATCAYVRLSTGEEAYINFDDMDYIPFINGHAQDDYLDVMYSD